MEKRKPRMDLAPAASSSGDPAEPVIAALTALADDVSRLVGEAREEAAKTVARAVAAELPGAVDRLVLYRYRRLLLVVVLGGVMLLGVGMACGYYLRGAGPIVQCADQKDGSRLCWRWERAAQRS